MAGVLQNSKGSRETSVSLAGYRNTFFSVPMHGMIFVCHYQDMLNSYNHKEVSGRI